MPSTICGQWSGACPVVALQDGGVSHGATLNRYSGGDGRSRLPSSLLNSSLPHIAVIWRSRFVTIMESFSSQTPCLLTGGREPDMEARILIVDDEKPILTYLSAVLARDGYSIVTTDNGAEALELVRNDDFDLVLCDLMMADINGLQVLEEVRERSPDTAFIVVTAYASVRSATAAMRLGASDYLLKPFDDEELCLRVRNAVEKYVLKKRYEARTRELESFVFAISHDIAGHLVAIRGFVRRVRVKSAERLDEEARLSLDRTDSSAEKMEKLVKAISDFARAGAPTGKKEMVDINEVVKDVLQNFHSIIEEEGVEVRVAPGLPIIEAEWINAYQIFHNLIGNAIKFRRGNVRPLIEIGVEDSGLHYRFHVRDNGIGVRREDREKIFEMFGRGGDGDQLPGTGLGLAIVRRILDKMGGDIWVESKEQVGSTFHFILLKQAHVQRETVGPGIHHEL